jgi:predicted NUDIX family NTP pyrophosphohydrolase
MPKISAGLLLFCVSDNGLLKILLVHPGGPYWKNKDEGAWTIPKGVVEEDEDLLVAAIREFTEETGLTPIGPFIPLGETKQKPGKKVYAWAFQGDCDPEQQFRD